MRVIELDATNWKTVLDFCNALLSAIGAPEWHSASADAFVDSMIWGGINAVEPPYTIKISGTAKLPKDVYDAVATVRQSLANGRIDYQRERGGDVDVAIETD